VTSGSIVNIAVSRNVPEEEKKMKEFWELQQSILTTFGTKEPEAPVVRVKNITQTSLILEWDPLVLHKAKLRSLDIYKNDTKLAQVKKKKKKRKEKTVKKVEVSINGYGSTLKGIYLVIYVHTLFLKGYFFFW
jgi:hypothetical protein